MVARRFLEEIYDGGEPTQSLLAGNEAAVNTYDDRHDSEAGCSSCHDPIVPWDILKRGSRYRIRTLPVVAKAGFLQSRQMRFADDGSIANALMSHLYIDRDLRWDEKFETEIKSLTAEQIRKAMGRYLNPGKMIVVQAGDFSKVKS